MSDHATRPSSALVTGGAGSAAAYGDDETRPKVEYLPPRCLSPCAVQEEYASEHYLALYTKLHGLQTVSLRHFNVHGPRQLSDSDYAAAVPSFIRAALAREPVRVSGDGDQTRDFIHVDDVVEANLLAPASDRLSGGVLNIASGRRTSVSELVSMIGKCAGCAMMVKYVPPARRRRASQLGRYHPGAGAVRICSSGRARGGVSAGRRSVRWRGGLRLARTAPAATGESGGDTT